MSERYIVIFGDATGVHRLVAGDDRQAALTVATALHDTGAAPFGVAVVGHQPDTGYWSPIRHTAGPRGSLSPRDLEPF